jgi:uncharacterized protein (TIGR00255 family)
MRSMTGFGEAATAIPGGRVAAQVRSVNHRFLDVRVVVPREYARWEGELRELVRGTAERGRLELVVSRTATAPGRGFRLEVHREVARDYVKVLRQLKAEMKLSGEVDLHLVGMIPDLVRVSEAPVDSSREMSSVRRVVQRALAALARDRRREGAYLGGDMRTRVRKLGRLILDLRRSLPEVVDGLSRRASERIRRFAGGVDIDPQRLAQEAAILAERSDVTEEIVRASSHITALRALLRASGPVGKRMEFLLQEVHREINTVGSKIGDLRVASMVLEAKADLEKLREQVQNVE